MEANKQSPPPADGRFPYELVDEMIKRHLASIRQSDEDECGRDVEGSGRDAEGSGH